MLTDAGIRAAIRAGGIKTLTDGGSRGSGRLVLSLRPDVRPEWYAVKWLDGKRKTVKLGTFPELSLTAARERFKDGVSFMKPQRMASLQSLIDAYVSNLEAREARTSDDIKRTLERLAAVIGSSKPANEVTTSDIVEAIRPVYADGKPSMADHMRGAIHACYGWVLKSQNDYRTESELKKRFGIAVNPASGIPTEPKGKGDRWLSLEELRQFWKWLHYGGRRNINRNTDPRNLVALHVLILTGQRVEEVLRLERSMVNRQLNVLEWDTTKMDTEHVVPASAQVLRRLTWCKRTGDGLFFPSYGDETTPTDSSTLRSICKAFVMDSGVEAFTTRDIRRTWKTLAGAAGITKTDRDLVQNHRGGDVSSQHYDRYDYLPEKRAALAKW